MLTWEENQGNFQVLKILSRFNLLPIQIDMKTGRIQMEKNGVKVWSWRFVYCLGTFQWMYVFGTLLHSSFQPKDENFGFRWDHFVVHFLVTCAQFLTPVFAYFLFVKDPTGIVILFNHVFQKENNETGQNSDPKIMDEETTTNKETEFDTEENKKQRVEKSSKEKENSINKNRRIFTWPLEYSIQELMAKVIFLVLSGTGIFVVLVLGIDPTRPQLLYALIPDSYKNWLIYMILLGVELFFFALFAILFCFNFLVQLEFLNKCEEKFKEIEKRLRNLMLCPQAEDPNPDPDPKSCSKTSLEYQKRNVALRQILNEMKELELVIELFNRCFPFCIYSFKMIAFGVGIFGFFFMIRHLHEHPFLSVFSGYCATYGSAMYVIPYENAFAVPKNMNRLKNLLPLAAQLQLKSTQIKSNSSDISLWPELNREVTRIRNVGIKVGSFHEMERISTPNFVDFVLRNVVNLLVTFPR